MATIYTYKFLVFGCTGLFDLQPNPILEKLFPLSSPFSRFLRQAMGLLWACSIAGSRQYYTLLYKIIRKKARNGDIYIIVARA